jgi:hypothetical protein
MNAMRKTADRYFRHIMLRDELTLKCVNIKNGFRFWIPQSM